MLISKEYVLDLDLQLYLSVGSDPAVEDTAVRWMAARAVQSTPWRRPSALKAICDFWIADKAAQLATSTKQSSPQEDFPNNFQVELGGRQMAMLLTDQILPDSSYQALRRHSSRKKPL